jgi:hypothetical protein
MPFMPFALSAPMSKTIIQKITPDLWSNNSAEGLKKKHAQDDS